MYGPYFLGLLVGFLFPMARFHCNNNLLALGVLISSDEPRFLTHLTHRGDHFCSSAHSLFSLRVFLSDRL